MSNATIGTSVVSAFGAKRRMATYAIAIKAKIASRNGSRLTGRLAVSPRLLERVGRADDHRGDEQQAEARAGVGSPARGAYRHGLVVGTKSVTEVVDVVVLVEVVVVGRRAM